MATEHAIGIDIGGTGIKGAVVDLGTGELVTERSKVRTPRAAGPTTSSRATEELLDDLDAMVGERSCRSASASPRS